MIQAPGLKVLYVVSGGGGRWAGPAVAQKKHSEQP